MKSPRPGTWFYTITELIKRYNIELTVEVSKSTWKKHVKKKISDEVENYVRLCCRTTTKGRTVAGDKFQMKRYFKEVGVETASEILKTRLHMRRLAGNYGDKKCQLCDEENASTEHYFTCPGTVLLRECCGITTETVMENMDRIE